MLKKGLSLFLALILAISVITVPVNATAGEDSAINTENIENDIRVESTNSLGEMLTDEYTQTTATEENTGCKIYETEVENTSVYVDLFTQTDAQLIVALYDDEGKTMYGSGVKTVTPEDKVVKVDINIDAMPEYYLIKAYLLDKKTNAPVCKQYECDTYTRTMQEFFAKTTDDFDAEKVLNLDNDKNNNFLVYSENTKLIYGNADTNKITTVDDENKSYIIENIDRSVSALQEGDIFSYNDGTENILIVKISSISIEGTTATIKGEDMDLEETFEYVKIDVSQGADATRVDNSNLEDGVEFTGSEDTAENRSSDKYATPVGLNFADVNIQTSSSLEFSVNKKFGSSKLSGTLGCKFLVNLECYYDAYLFEDDEIKFSFKLGYEVKLSMAFEIEITETMIELGDISFMPVPGVSIFVTPAFVIEGKIKAEISGTLSGEAGKEFHNGKFSDISKPAEFVAEFKVEAEVFIGLVLEPGIGIGGKVITASMKAKSGVKISAELTYSTKKEVTSATQIHSCAVCADGKMEGVIELSFSLMLVDNDKLEWKATAFEYSVHLCDFYFSFDNLSFGLNSCPNIDYKQTFLIEDLNGKPIENADVNGHKTNSLGSVSFFMSNGDQKVTVKKDDVSTIKEIFVESFDIHVITLDTQGEQNEETEPDTEATNPTDPTSPTIPQPPVSDPEIEIVNSGMCGEFAHYTLFSDGTLEIGGSGDMYDYIESLSPFYENSFIKKVIVGGTVSSVGGGIFYGCKNLTDVLVGDSVEYINEHAFFYCESLNNLCLGDGVKEIGFAAFYHCTSLQKINLPTYLRKIEQSVFGRCSSLEYANLGENVTSIGACAFNYCTSLKTVTIPAGVRFINNETFYNCHSLKEVNLNEGVQSIGESAFAFCYDLEKIVVPDSVYEIKNNAFQNCYFTTAILGKGIQSIGESAFLYCYNLEKIVIPDSVYEIKDHAFALCNYLNTVILGKSVQTIGKNAFERCLSLEKIVIPDSVCKIKERAFQDCSNLTTVILGKGVHAIGDFAFSNNENNTGIPSHLTNIYYRGSESDWNNINISSNNDELFKTTIYYNYADKSITPTEKSIPSSVGTTSGITTSSNRTSSANKFSRSDLAPHSQAVLMLVKNTTSDYLIDPTSLLYITQTTVDENGTAEFTTYGEFPHKNWVVVIYGKCNHPSTVWKTISEPTVLKKGQDICICNKCKEIINTRTTTTQIPDHTPGDVNLDGKININDATAMQRAIANMTTLNDRQLISADVNKDGELNINDVTLLQKYLADLVPYLGVQP